MPEASPRGTFRRRPFRAGTSRDPAGQPRRLGEVQRRPPGGTSRAVGPGSYREVGLGSYAEEFLRSVQTAHQRLQIILRVVQIE